MAFISRIRNSEIQNLNYLNLLEIFFNTINQNTRFALPNEFLYQINIQLYATITEQMPEGLSLTSKYEIRKKTANIIIICSDILKTDFTKLIAKHIKTNEDVKSKLILVALMPLYVAINKIQYNDGSQ